MNSTPKFLPLMIALTLLTFMQAQAQIIHGTGSYKGAAPGWDRGLESTMHCGNNPESWVRGSATLNKDSGILSITVQLETDSVLAGPKGRLSIEVRDVAGKQVYRAVTDEIGIGGKPTGKAAIQNFSSTIMVPRPIASTANSMYLDAECTGSINRLFNIDPETVKSFLVIANSLIEPTQNTPEQQKRVSHAFAAAGQIARPETPEFTAALRQQLLAAGGTIPQKTLKATSIDRDERYREHFRDETRVWGGSPVIPGTFPDTVAITGNEMICTGTVIGLRSVLTAAHCFCDGVKQTVYFGDTVAHATSTANVLSGQSMIPCGADPPLEKGDVAVLTLDAPLNVPPRALANSALVNVAKTGQAVGFGVGSGNPVIDPAGIKRMVEVPMVSPSCSGTVSTSSGQVGDATYYKCVSGLELVAGAPSLNKDTCKGDSGGPLYVSGSDGSLYLAATTSRATGTPGLRPCGDGGIYVRTDGNVVQWIKSLGINVLIGPPR